MSVPGSINQLLIGAAGAGGGGYEISRSLRFNPVDSSYLNRTPSSAGNQRTFTLSFWAKLCDISSNTNYIYTAGSGSPGGLNSLEIGFDLYNRFVISEYGASGSDYYVEKTLAYHRDPSAWYHFIVAVDTTQATATNRVKFYVNGVEQTKVSTSLYFPENRDTAVNSTTVQTIGSDGASDLDGYLAKVHLIDGQALAATDFGEFDSNNVWQPKAFAGTYGTNGFKLDFSDISSDAALGTDSSGNSNTWTVNNLTAGSGVGPGITTTVPEDLTGNWTGIIGIVPTDTSGAVAVFPDGSGTGSTKGTFFWSGLTVGDTITWYGTSSGSTRSVVGNVDETSVSVPGGSLGSFQLTVSAASGSAKVDFNGTANCYGITPGPVSSEYTDALRDSPSQIADQTDTGAGGEVVGNYATWNPLFGENQSLSNGNLKAASSATGYAIIASTIAMKSGKWYMEYTYTPNNGQPYITWGISQTNRDGSQGSGVTDTPEDKGFKAWDSGFYSQSDGVNIYNYSSSVSSGDIISLAFDADAGKLWVAKNGTYMTNASGAGNPTAGTNPDYSGLNYSGGYYFMAGPYYTNGSTLEANFGQRSWAYAAPTNFKALCTANLPDPTIADGSTAFDAKTFTANNGTQTISGFNFSPDLIWTKSRANAYAHQLWDQVRGTNKALSPNDTSAEANLNNSLAFTSDGFTSGTNNNANYGSGGSIAWAWDAGSSTVTNTDGSISSQVRANPSAGFSIVSYTGTGSAATVGHGLNAAPEFIITKSLANTTNWVTGHEGITWNNFMSLDTADAQGASAAVWNNTAPDSNVFSVASSSYINPAGSDVIGYCFCPVEGYSAFGSYEGNGLADGPFIYTGFKIEFLLIKSADTAQYWYLADSARSPYNDGTTEGLWANTADVEFSYDVDFLSNGFKHYNQSANLNSVHTFIYAAFASHPFRSARAR